MFAPQIEALSDRYRCIAFDFRGQGRSQVTDAGYDMDTLAVDAAALIERLGAAPCHLVGLPVGGFVAIRGAARRPHTPTSVCPAIRRQDHAAGMSTAMPCPLRGVDDVTPLPVTAQLGFRWRRVGLDVGLRRPPVSRVTSEEAFQFASAGR